MRIYVCDLIYVLRTKFITDDAKDRRSSLERFSTSFNAKTILTLNRIYDEVLSSAVDTFLHYGNVHLKRFSKFCTTSFL